MSDRFSLSPAEHAVLDLGRSPYEWQMDALESIGLQEYGGLPTSLVAANGSGKTCDVIATAVSWFLTRYPLGWVVITSGSWNQLKNQLWPSLSILRQKNPGWVVRRGAECMVTTPEGRAAGIGGAIGFSTKNAGRAEGWHPKLGPGIDPVMIIVDEAKSVPNEIFEAFDRCTALIRLLSSSPGGPVGYFYDSHHQNRSLFQCFKATSADCPHIAPAKIARDRHLYGEDHYIFRSMHKAEFTEGADSHIISADLVAKALQASLSDCEIPKGDAAELTVFCDFAAGRDENVIACCDGRRAWILDAWKETDTVQGARQCIAKLQAAGIPPWRVWGDADGLGIGFCHQMAEQGYRIKEFRGGVPAVDEDHYSSTISETWFEEGRKVARGEIILCGDLARGPATIKQLTTRKTQYDAQNRLRAEKKEDMKKRGLKSPDRADAILGAINRHFYSGGAFTAETATQSELGDSPFAPEIVSGW